MTVPYTPPAVTPDSLRAHARYLQADGDTRGAESLNAAAKRLQAQDLQKRKDDVIAAAIFHEIYPTNLYHGVEPGKWRAAAAAARKAVVNEQILEASLDPANRHITR